MYRVWNSLALGALLTQNALSLPIQKNGIAALKQLLGRSEAGPEMGGANFPDPCIIHADKWYSFATRTIGSSIHIQVATSWDFNTWTLQKKSDGSQYDALPNLPSWVASTPNTWAPDVSQLDDGSFLMYYAATTNQDTRKHCIGAAKASSPLGPYTPISNSPLICPLSQGGAIDPAGFEDPNTRQRYIVYKIDGNTLGHGGACNNDVAPYVSTPIMIQPVASDGITFQGGPNKILDNNGAGDQGSVEAPTLTKTGNVWFLYFSSGCFVTNNYNVNYATASSPFGPYTRAARPLFRTGDYGLSAPGGADISKDNKWMLFHASNNGGRSLYTAIVTPNGNTVTA